MLVESRMELRIPYRLRGPFILFPSDKFGKDSYFFLDKKTLNRYFAA